MSFTIRQALPSDIPQIRDIYNYYVRNTTISLKLHEASDEYVASRFNGTSERGLPYFVAVSSLAAIASVSTQIDDGKERGAGEDADADGGRGVDGTGDVILGYAHLSPFSADKAGYSPAVELTLYLRSDSISGGIGTALMKQMIDWVVRKRYRAFEGDQIAKREDEIGGGDQNENEDRHGSEWVEAKQVYAIMSQDVEGREGWVSRGEKNREWYAGKFGFREVGRLPGIGEKFGKR